MRGFLRSGPMLAVLAPLVLTGLAVLLVAGAIFVRLYNQPFDFSAAAAARGIQLPPQLTRLKQREWIPYWTHTSSALALAAVGAHPEAVAAQWVKAAAHARTPSQVGRAGQGLRTTAERLGSLEAAAAVFCPLAGGSATTEQRQAYEVAGLRCDRTGTADAERPAGGQ